ncbi:sulfate permease [Desulfuromonas acetoxidans]|uniref:Sulfate permease n=1 Tax=Desulfuromonas acetoxidans (strain DSM 684 / 11070) TaxID=281689 RepID=Q1K3P5_DESA6|nr:sulfate permease [Desulfuromonas acetoxidans]EAT16929.1 sulfate permease [Desulfuromonas acetoxidans DSM 684]MBF0644542.1 sulfate permease [Desulfuromonas acetoxidans]NVD23931.1 sulfate permease [Desulfuromonas acetoxidans]NVE16228.1 sulfate permease [Desulfuromonas acetoxidans]
MTSRLVPELWCCLKEGYNRQRLVEDLLSGMIVGIVALPLAIAFAIASGVKPEQGLYTAVIAGFLISLLSGSRVQIGGPTGAFIVVVFSIVQQYGYGGLAVATIMAGALLVVMGVCRLGGAIKFIPYPMTIGFTSGIALIIAITQGKDLLGLTLTRSAEGIVDRVLLYVDAIDTLNLHAVIIAGLAMAILLLWPKVTKKVPGSIIALLVTTALVHVMDWPVATIGSAFGDVPSTLPMPHLPSIDLAMVPQLISPALTIALLAAIESLLSAVVADGMTGRRHKSNMELVAQGVANIASPLFGGIPATGAIARTATNVKSGGTSPVSGIVHALTLLLIMMLFGRWARLIPMATLAAILLIVAYHMSEWRHFVKLFRSPRNDIVVMLTTFVLTVFVDLTVAIETGVVLSALLFMQRMANATEVRHISREINDEEDEEDDQPICGRQIPSCVEVFEIHGPFFFGATNQFKDTLSIIKEPPQILILRMRHIFTIDATAIRVLEDVLEKTQRDGTQLMLSGVRPHLLKKLQKTHLYDEIGQGNIFAEIDTALTVARGLCRKSDD